MATDTQLAEHIYDLHFSDVEPVLKYVPVPAADEMDDARPGLVAVVSAYSEAIAMRVREGAPLATYPPVRRRSRSQCCKHKLDDGAGKSIHASFTIETISYGYPTLPVCHP